MWVSVGMQVQGYIDLRVNIVSSPGFYLYFTNW